MPRPTNVEAPQDSRQPQYQWHSRHLRWRTFHNLVFQEWLKHKAWHVKWLIHKAKPPVLWTACSSSLDWQVVRNKNIDLGGKWLFIATRWNSFWRLVISNHFWSIATPQKEPWRRDHRETERGNRNKLTPWHMQCVCWCVYACVYVCVSDTDTSTKSFYCSDVQWTQR